MTACPVPAGKFCGIAERAVFPLPCPINTASPAPGIRCGGGCIPGQPRCFVLWGECFSVIRSGISAAKGPVPGITFCPVSF